MGNCLKTAVLGLIALLVGTMLYIFFRPASYVSVIFGTYGWLSQLRTWLKPFPCDFLRYYLPDMLWALALGCGLQTILIPKGKGIVLCGVAAFASGVVWELLQWLGTVRGTGDWLDILMYALGSLASILFTKKEIGK